MKRTLLGLSLGIALPALSLASSAPAFAPNNIDPFTNFYVGAGLGLNVQTLHHRFESTTDAVGYSLDNSTTGVNLNGLVGYNYGFAPDWLVGLDAHAQYNTASKIEINDHLFGVVTNSKSIIQWQYGLSLKVGFAPFARNMFYVLAGPEWAQFKHSYSSSTGASGSATSTQFGGLVGAGLSQSLIPHLNLTEQVTYGFFQSYAWTIPSGHSSFTPRDVTATLGLEYHF